LAWEEGLSAFVTNQVPFSFSCGRVLAEALSHLVRGLAEDSDEVVVMELGAGIGYLSNYCLDVLAESDPVTYKKSRFLVTDGQPEVVADAKRLGVLSGHGTRANFAVADLRDPDLILAEAPRLLILSYQVDAIPPSHLEQREDGVYEGNVETTVPESATFFDGLVWPPRKVTASEIVELLGGGVEEMTPVLGRRIVSLVKETWSWQPTDQKIVTGSLLNSRQDLVHELCDLLGNLQDDSAILITDFGYVKANPTVVEELMTEYGLCAFWAVAFLEIIAIAQASGYEVMLNPRDEGGTHTLLIYEGDRIDRMRVAFTDGFKGLEADRPNQILDALTNDSTVEEVKAAVKLIEETFPEEEINTYGNLSSIAHLLLPCDDIEGAAAYARKCVDLYPAVAAPELAILGSVAGKNGEFDEAVAYFNQTIDVSPGFANGYMGLCEVYRTQQKWPQYFETMKRLMSITDCDVVDVMERIAETLVDTELSAEAEVASRWLAEQSN